MRTAGKQLRRDCYTRAANEDSIHGGLRTRTKYRYDALDRLTKCHDLGHHRFDGWTYDADGNRLTQTGASASTFHINSGNNQLSSTTGALARTYVYNAAGMTTAFSSDVFSYNNRGRMMGVSVGSTNTSYLYNALGQLVEKATSAPTNLYVYDEAGHILGEYDGSGNLIEETVWLGGIPVATLRPNGSSIAINYVHSNHLNTPTKVTRSSDNALEWACRPAKDPRSARRCQNSGDPGGIGIFAYNLRFLGQLYMGETGLNYNYFRDYDPQVGRYVESDPIGLAGGLNTYAYVNSNPLEHVDSSGEGIVDCPAAIVKLLRATANLNKRLSELKKPVDAGHLKSLSEAQNQVQNAKDLVAKHCGCFAGAAAALAAAAVAIAAAAEWLAYIAPVFA